jgi:hypothetical protein
LNPKGNQYPQQSVGTFSVLGGINGGIFSIGDLTFGTPPLDVPDPSSGNLAPHSQFPTYYREIDFKFLSSQTLPAYDTATNASSPGCFISTTSA